MSRQLRSKEFQSSLLLQRALGLSDLKMAELLNPLNISTIENLAKTHSMLQNNAEALSYYDKLVEMDSSYLMDRSYFLLARFPERQLDGCKDMYEAAYLGDPRAISDLSNIKLENQFLKSKKQSVLDNKFRTPFLNANDKL